jgi:hypothetical protein
MHDYANDMHRFRELSRRATQLTAKPNANKQAAIAVLTVASIIVCLDLHRKLPSVGLERTRSSYVPATMCVERSGGITREGAGSFVQHIKSSIILAAAIGADLRLPGVGANEHNYAPPWISNSTCPDAPVHLCSVNHTALIALLPSICHGILRGTTLIDALGNLEQCNTIYHVVDQSEIFEDMNDCIGPWYKQSLDLLSPTRTNATRVGGVARIGIHVRWGDLASAAELSRNSTLDYRSPSIRQINEAFSRIIFSGCNHVHVKLYIERHPPVAPGTFVFSDYSIVDSGDALNDLRDYASNDILIQGISSWAVFGAFGSPADAIVITDTENVKYRQIYNRALKLFRFGHAVFFKCV